jgi:hypothetical protein
MLAAVSGLAFLLSTLLKLDSSLGYFLPLPIVIAACRSGPGAAWNTMMATSFLLLGGCRAFEGGAASGRRGAEARLAQRAERSGWPPSPQRRPGRHQRGPNPAAAAPHARPQSCWARCAL